MCRGVQYTNIFSMLSSVLWPSDRPLSDQDYDFVYPLNMSEHGEVQDRSALGRKCANLHNKLPNNSC